jgi:hypothetical protein
MSEPSRPTYESPADLENEEAVVKAIYKGLGCDGYHKTPKFSAIDFALLRGAVVTYFVEVKCRKNKRDRYKEFMLSLAKYDALLLSRKLNQTTSLLVVRWLDCIGLLTIPPPTLWIGIGGRNDRNDPDDMEPVVYIPTYHFQTFQGGDRD